MSTVLLIIQLIISIALTGLILIQRSEGGALGIGGGGGGGGFMSGKSAANSVSRMTGILGGAFIVNCLLLSVVFNKENQNISLIDDTNAVESLTITPESGETQNPLATETLASETEENIEPQGEMASETVTSETTTNATEDAAEKPKNE